MSTSSTSAARTARPAQGGWSIFVATWHKSEIRTATAYRNVLSGVLEAPVPVFWALDKQD
ncbi:hypothetical protein [Halotalea alkalilenta]|uniref:hypothetical protein n=1 Tax=Halotalea alkalilenta TaxID=376489 RepID=UPI0004816386|nr:hypothetical protein [Halotalea alkalilenta]